jgi:phosphatidylserine decarboxylase
MEVLKLSKTIETLAGDKVSELKFDFDSLKTSDYRNIVRLESRLRGVSFENEMNVAKITSSEFRMATAWVAAVNVAENHICFDDIDRISFLDLLEMEKLGAFFILHVE